MENEQSKRRATTVTKLRDATPSRRTPGKSSARDPAVAPFDTDDEAAGRSPTREAIARAIAEEAPKGRRRRFPKDEEKRMPPDTARAVVSGVVLLMVVTLVLVYFAVF